MRDLPGFARGAMADVRRAQATRLSDEVRRTDWSVPEPFDSVRFHVIRTQRWRPVPSRRLVIISPFVAAEALSALAETTDDPVALVSRPETLAALETDPAGTFEQVFALDDAAESEDGEETPERDTMGLHAKALLAEDRGEVHLYIGSANSTSAALIAGRNVEVLAELTGRRYRVGGVDAFLGEEGLGGYLMPWSRETSPREEGDDAERLGEESLEGHLRGVMCRTERVAMTRSLDSLLVELPRPAALDSTDLRQARIADRLSRALRAPDVIEYWKSSPYLLSYMRNYKLRERLDDVADNPPEEVLGALAEEVDVAEAAPIRGPKCSKWQPPTATATFRIWFRTGSTRSRAARASSGAFR